jgi:signal transduction histidine kinase
VADEHLGLFDTPPSRREILIGLLIVGLLIGATLLVLTFGDTRLPEIRAFIPGISAAMFVSEVIIAAMLFGQAAVFRSQALAILASGFLFVALLLIGYVLTFPGVFDPQWPLSGGANSAAWLMIVRRLSFPVIIILYVAWWMWGPDSRREKRPSSSRSTGHAMTAIVLAMLVTVVAIAGHAWLPAMFADRAQAIASNLLKFNLVSIAITVNAILILALKRQSVLDLWLQVALAGWLIPSLLNLTLEARFTPGWYGLMVISSSANLLVLVALVGESNRLYARLALTSAARERERDSKLISMEALAATVSHEVRQPLAAVSLNALACKSWLQRESPNIERALESIGEVMESSRRTSDILKSVGTIFTGSQQTRAQFDLNSLVRETSALMASDLATAKIGLGMLLADAALPVQANRLQIQEVIINILANAIDSLVSSDVRQRSIWISTVELGETIAVEISDNGPGVVPAMAPRLFKAFQTSKPSGTGIGLSLCRTIMENHGGSIRASGSPGGGATFRLEIPRARTELMVDAAG